MATKDKSIAGAITRATLYGLKVVAIAGVGGGLAFVIGEHFWKEATAPVCSDDITATIAGSTNAKSGLITLKDNSLCKLTFTPS